jgi:hypothetical protein
MGIGSVFNLRLLQLHRTRASLRPEDTTAVLGVWSRAITYSDINFEKHFLITHGILPNGCMMLSEVFSSEAVGLPRNSYSSFISLNLLVLKFKTNL